MKFLEKDLEQIIYESKNEDLRIRNLPIYGYKIRQLRIGNYGIADLVTIEKDYRFIYKRRKIVSTLPHLVITVYELKKENVGISAYLQAVGYAKGVQSYLRKRGFYRFEINISLVGKDIDTSGSFCFITDLFINNYVEDPCGCISKLKYYTYSYDLKGLTFKCINGYGLTDEGFNIKPF